MGSSVYGFVGKWVPKGLVGWMMGVRKVSHSNEFGGGSGSGIVSAGASRSTSPGSARSAGSAGIFGDSEYVSVYGESAPGDE